MLSRSSLARSGRVAAAVCTVLTLGFAAAIRPAAAATVEVGSPAPVFEALDDSGAPWKSTDHVGKKILVVYFYPADMTGGCTKQACGFRDDLATLADRGVTVVGVSGDSVGNHQLFKKAHALNFPLLADVDGAVAAAFGVPVTLGEKTVTCEIDGKTESLVRNVTAKRWTFVIGRDGKVAARNTEVAAAEDSRAILTLVEALDR